MFISSALLLSFFVTAQAGCDNACSGHGSCQLDGVCDCYDNWGMGLSRDSGDCSDRVCPFEIAWIDAPDNEGTRHNYAECAGRGLCNRESGDCECFPGYEGKACQRAVCPNDCSGHGQCTYMNNFPYQVTPFDWFNNYYSSTSSVNNDFLPQSPHQFTYYGWDNQKTRGCMCDPEWGDVDCSKRMCPYGNDVMDHRDNMNTAQKYHTQTISFKIQGTDTSQDGNTFALTFKSKLNETFTTTPIVFDSSVATGVAGTASDFADFSRDVKTALEALPNNVIDLVVVTTTSTNSNNEVTPTITISFTGAQVQGKQNLLTMRTYECGDGCTPKLSGLELVPGNSRIFESIVADFNSYECGRRGKCNYDTGICQCFSGYTGSACNTATALV